jgi:hypothetical protein
MLERLQARGAGQRLSRSFAFGELVPCLWLPSFVEIAPGLIQLKLGLFVSEQSQYLLPLGRVGRFAGESAIAINILSVDEPFHGSLLRLTDI